MEEHSDGPGDSDVNPKQQQEKASLKLYTNIMMSTAETIQEMAKNLKTLTTENKSLRAQLESLRASWHKLDRVKWSLLLASTLRTTTTNMYKNQQQYVEGKVEGTADEQPRPRETHGREEPW